MPRISSTWAALVETIKRLRTGVDVRPLPLERFTDEDLFKVIPGLKLPAAVVVFRGNTREAKGNGATKNRRWSIVLALADAKGDGYLENLAFAEDLEDELVGTDIGEEGNRAWVLGDTDLEPVNSSPRKSIYELQLTTRHAEV